MPLLLAYAINRFSQAVAQIQAVPYMDFFPWFSWGFAVVDTTPKLACSNNPKF